MADESEEAFMEHNIQLQQPSMRKGRYFQLREKGYLTISGRVNRNFFMEKFCYGKTGKEG